MKKILIILSLLVVTKIGFSQPYKPVLASDTTQWNYLTDYRADWYYTLVFKAYNDTIINTISYKKLYVTSVINFGLFGFVREDTVAGKLWFKPEGDTNEHLCMDISLGMNDTMEYTTSDGEVYNFVATEIDTIDGRKVITCSNDVQFIEGVGSSLGFEYIISRCSVSNLLCMYQNNVQQYLNSEYNSCNVTIAYVKKISDLSTIQIFVTSSGVLTVASVQSTVPVTRVAVLDITGRTIINDRFDSQTAEIDVSSLKAGVYLVKVNQTVVKKIVIP